MSRFKVGDKVKVIESASIDERKVRIIEDIINTKDKQLINLLYGYIYYEEHELELIESEIQFTEMNLKDVISQLESLKEDAESRIDKDDKEYCVYKDDVKALDIAIKCVKLLYEKEV